MKLLFGRSIALVAFLMGTSGPGILMAQVFVTTYKNDPGRTGLYSNESALKPTTVSSNSFGKIFSTPVDGQVYAQPLYVSGVTNIKGGIHNVLYVATEHDSIFAIDADDGSILWQHPDPNNPAGDKPIVPVQFTEVGNTASGGCADLKPEIGITGTPVIDLSSQTIYYITKSKEAGIVQRLHAVDLVSGLEKFGGPVLISAKVKGSGSGSEAGFISFAPQTQLNRPGLLLDRGHVVAAWGGHCDVDPYHGWVMSYNASTLKQEAVFNTSPNGYKAGVWMAGDGMAADQDGNLYFATGNGKYDGSAGADFGDSIVKLTLGANGTLTVADWFTPGDQKKLDKQDLDLGSGGVLILPDLPSGVAHQHVLLQMGKDETIHLIDRDNMGKFCGTDNCADSQILQEISNNPSAGGIWGSPAYWHGAVYWAGGLGPDKVKGWTVNGDHDGLLSSSPTSSSTVSFRGYSSNPVVSSMGDNDGILWILDDSAALRATGPQVLYAFDAAQLGNMLYNSGQAANGRDQGGPAVKFATPIVANGKVYAGGGKVVTAWGLLGTQASH